MQTNSLVLELIKVAKLLSVKDRFLQKLRSKYPDGKFTEIKWRGLQANQRMAPKPHIDLFIPHSYGVVYLVSREGQDHIWVTDGKEMFLFGWLREQGWKQSGRPVVHKL